MNSLTVPIGLPIEIKKSGAPDTQGLILQEFKYPLLQKNIICLKRKKDSYGLNHQSGNLS